jgi:hypothetical protein
MYPILVRDTRTAARRNFQPNFFRLVRPHGRKIPHGRPMGFPFDRRIVAQEHFFTSNMKVIHLIMKNVKQKLTEYRKTSYEGGLS